MTITVWQKMEFENEKSIPPLQAILTYQTASDKKRVHCQITFSTPYPVAKTCLRDGIKASRFGDKVICYFTLEDGQYKTLRIDHPDQPIYGCIVYYDRKKNPVPYVHEPAFNMSIEVQEGHVYMSESGVR